MKKILFLLLVTISSYGQTLQNPTYGNTTTNTLKVKTNTESVTGTNKIPVQETDGIVNYIQSINIPVPYIPTSYSPTTQTLKGQLEGINTKLGAAQTTAGNTARVRFTADNVTVNSVVYFQSSISGSGTATAGSPPTLSLGDNVKAFFTKDVISILQPTLVKYPPGTYAGQLTVSTTPTPNATQQRFTIEIYKTDSNGVAIASGVAGAPIGSLGVAVVTILDSKIINLVAGSITNVSVSGELLAELTVNPNERIKYHVSAQKIGTGGGNVTMQVYYGSNYSSYYDVPIPITTDGVLNKSTVTPAITNTDALNLLNSSKLSGSGTANFIPKLTSASSLGNSLLYDTGTQIGLGTSNPMQTLHMVSSIDNGYLKITTSTTGSSLSDGSNIGVNSSRELDIANLENTNLNFYTNNLLRSRITNAGRHLLGTTTDNLKDILQVSGTISYLGLSFTSVTTGSPDIIFSTVPLGSQKTIGTINVDAGYGVADAILESYAYTTSGYGMQRITYTSGSLANRVFVRSLSVGIWTSWVEISSGRVKRYKAIISQTGTGAPTVKVLENSIGTITFGYSSVGGYTISSSGLFTVDKTFWNIPSGPNGNNTNSINQATASLMYLWSTNVVTGVNVNNGMADTPILIEVYP